MSWGIMGKFTHTGVSTIESFPPDPKVINLAVISYTPEKSMSIAIKTNKQTDKISALRGFQQC